MNKRIWFITGISSGIGKALTSAVVNHGDYVIGTFRSQEQVDTFNTQQQGKAESVLCDITDHTQIEEVIKSTQEKHGKIDILVNNAGVGMIGAVEETSIEEARALFDANVFGTLKMTQTVLPMMRSHRQGHIVQISSQSGIKASAGFGIYNSTKFALEGFSEALAQEVRPLGIHVSLINLGPYRTDFAGRSLREADNIIEDYNQTAGAFRQKLHAVDGKQPGDPDKAAQAIIDHVNSDNPSLRLPLGKLAIMQFESKIQSLQSDLDANREVAEGAVYEE